MTLCTLSTAALSLQEEDAFVSLRKGAGLTAKQFRRDVQAVAAYYASCRSAALVCQDSYNFTVGLYGLLHAGVRIVLPPGNQPIVIEALQDTFETMIDDSAIEMAAAGSSFATLDPLDPFLPMIDFCTSGTTGTPKLVAKSLAMFDRELAVLDPLIRLTGRQKGKILATVPHQHVYGFTFKLMGALACGHSFTTETYALWESLLPESTVDSIVVSSPAHLGRLAGLEPLPASRRPRLILSAGAPLSLQASQDVQAVLGCRPTEIFGSTETGAIAMRSLHDGQEPWRVLPTIEVRSDKEHKMSVLTPFIGDAWIDVADLIECVDGGFHHHGRADRIVKIEGKRINLITVEMALQAHPLIETAAVVALGEPPHLGAVVILSAEGRQALEAQGAFRLGRQLRKALASSLDPVGMPRLWRFVDVFPNQTMGKRRAVDLIGLFGEDA